MKRQVTNCKYGKCSDIIVRDQLVFGPSNQNTRRRLLSEFLILDIAVEITVGIEQAERDAVLLTAKIFNQI